VGIGKTIRIRSIHVHYDLAVPADAREATERALALHPVGCPARQSVKGAIDVTWDATVRVGDQTIAHCGKVRSGQIQLPLGRDVEGLRGDVHLPEEAAEGGQAREVFRSAARGRGRSRSRTSTSRRRRGSAPPTSRRSVATEGKAGC
jgi:hypothetical protein